MKIVFYDKSKFFSKKSFYANHENLQLKNMLGERYGSMERNN